MSHLENARWRYATKKFDTDKTIPDADLEKLKTAIQLSVSSYGIQPYKVLIISDEKLLEKLRDVSFDQKQLTQGNYLFVFCSYTDVTDEDVDELVALKKQCTDKDPEKIEKSAKTMKKDLNSRTKEEKQHWAAKQCYIALGNLLAMAAELRIDACPMEGFKPEKYDDILDLHEQGLEATVIAAVGYRADNDEYQHQTKVRRTKEQLFVELTD